MERWLNWSFPSVKVCVRTVSERKTVTSCLQGGWQLLCFAKNLLSCNLVLQFITCETDLLCRSCFGFFFFLWFLHLWKRSWEEEYKRSQNTYFSQCDSTGNRKARNESKIAISGEGAEDRRQTRSLLSCREAGSTCLFNDFIISLKGEREVRSNNCPRALFKLNKPSLSHGTWHQMEALWDTGNYRSITGSSGQSSPSRLLLYSLFSLRWVLLGTS